ncbi:MAG: phosphate ABC transporter substrate-binding protein PstS [Aquabacterium sp.]
MLFVVRKILAGVVLTWVASGALANAVQISGAGATFPARVYARWTEQFASQNPRVQVQYKPTGSGDGVKQIGARSVHFGGTDTPLSPQELAQKGLIQIPMLVGGLVPVVNLPGVGSNKLVLDGATLAEIMLGRINNWNDPALAKLNPGLNLPAKPIVRVVREDSSGSTEGFTRYLALSSSRFKQTVGESKKPTWPGKVIEAKGNDGVVDAVREQVGGITYVSYDRVAKDQLTAVKLVNPTGRAVAASEEGFKEAILGSDVYRQGDDSASLLNVARKEAWPITLTSYVLLDTRPKDKVAANWSAHYVYWCFMHGDDLTRGTGFAPLPSRVQAKLVARLTQIHGPDGEVPKFIQP